MLINCPRARLKTIPNLCILRSEKLLEAINVDLLDLITTHRKIKAHLSGTCDEFKSPVFDIMSNSILQVIQ